MQIIAAVVLYNPDQNIEANIRSYCSAANCLLIYDNSPNSHSYLADRFTNCFYFHDGTNKGIAKRLNEACRFSIEHGYTFLLTMDQDSSFKENGFAAYLDCLSSFDNPQKVGLFGVGFSAGASRSTSCEAIETDKLITSGSILNLDAYSKIGPFDENLFIDEVDHEYCYRAKLSGFSIIRFNHIHLEHALGDVQLKRSLRNLKQTGRRLYSPTRIYYMVRNFFYLQKKISKSLPRKYTGKQESIKGTHKKQSTLQQAKAGSSKKNNKSIQGL